MDTTSAMLASKVFDAVLDYAAKHATRSLFKKLTKFIGFIKSTYGPHLEKTLQKCRYVKTLVHGDVPIDLLSMYVNVKFSLQGKTIEDFDIIEGIHTNFKRLVISGTAGSGKTVFMKYLFISLYENPRGRIPIFFELRSLNKADVRDVIHSIYYNVFHSPKDFSREEFSELAKEGAFTFIFDGYDEINHDIREKIEKNILQYAEQYPECIFVVSGRPDEGFKSWEQFKVLRAAPLDKKQVISLIEKIEYDSESKQEFISELKKEIYDKYRDLLSNPLTVTMMFLAHQTGAKIPKKLHLFYELVFHALYERHDGIKQSFKRKKYCDLSIDTFADIFSTLCFLSYIDEKYEFTQEEFIPYLREAIKYTQSDIHPDDFQRDLTESVCMIQKDGMTLSFVHRSFQEFLLRDLSIAFDQRV